MYCRYPCHTSQTSLQTQCPQVHPAQACQAPTWAAGRLSSPEDSWSQAGPLPCVWVGLGLQLIFQWWAWEPKEKCSRWLPWTPEGSWQGVLGYGKHCSDDEEKEEETKAKEILSAPDWRVLGWWQCRWASESSLCSWPTKICCSPQPVCHYGRRM